MKVIIAGGRNITNYRTVKNAIIQSGFKISEVVSGNAKWVDILGEKWADENKIHIEPFPAGWDDLSHPDAIIKKGKYGKYDAKAGIRRNSKMAEYADALIAIWDGKSRGTGDMIRTMKTMKKPVFIKYLNGDFAYYGV